MICRHTHQGEQMILLGVNSQNSKGCYWWAMFSKKGLPLSLRLMKKEQFPPNNAATLMKLQ